MPALAPELRNAYEKDVIRAREAAEAAAGAALAAIGLADDRPPAGLDESGRALRVALRARARQLGEGELERGRPALVEEIAYEGWHRMLFARFLAENHLLMHPAGVAVTLEECAELAAEEGAADAWELAGRYAAAMLPGIFRPDDPATRVAFAPEGRDRLERIVVGLPRSVFTSEDGLGWSYQFWQSAKKKEVNASERKIGGADIAPVTQMFTEDYMVKFLLHNTLGAWWAARHPDSPLNRTFEYLRYKDDGSPAAGTFDGWPATAAEVTMMDPCGGSGHFIVAAFEMFVRMRMEEEGLSAREAGDAVIRDNVYMLELDLRCTQIAAFNLALAAWKTGGYRQLPTASIACSGIPVAGQLDDWLKLAGDDPHLKRGLERLYELFRHAPDLGSLIDPAAAFAKDPLFGVNFERLAPLLRKALAGKNGADPEAALFETAVTEAAQAAELLARNYTLVATNVPYLGQNKQSDELFKYLERYYPESKWDLATAFTERCIAFSLKGGTQATVSPQNWLFIGSYKKLRKSLLRTQKWQILCWLGAGAFETISGEVVKPVLLITSNQAFEDDHKMYGVDVSNIPVPIKKSEALISLELSNVLQSHQLRNSDARISLTTSAVGLAELSKYADSYWGIGTGDGPRFQRQFWEVAELADAWEYLQSTFAPTHPFSGKTSIVLWEKGNGPLVNLAKELNNRPTRGDSAWGKKGVAISLTSGPYATLYFGEIFQNGVGAVVPKDPAHLIALWAFVSSDDYPEKVKEVDRRLGVTNHSLIKVPFDLAHWQQVAAEQYPDGLPEPHSNDPTQWLFKGHPAGATYSLQVAVARLLGYRWPEQPESDELDALTGADGIACLPPVGGEPPTDERLRAVLAAAYGPDWSISTQDRLLAEAGYGGKSLAEWLRDGFFAQHCKLFHNRPFIWHVWDGRKDGFSALVNYHKLDAARLERLIYTYLGEWVRARRADAARGEAAAEGRLAAALALQKKLKLIAAGEPPYDIYVRWKGLQEQPIGWQPDLNDGVRLNIRPWVTAGVLRGKFTINWNKDRGKNADGSERLNDLHYTLEQKRKARAATADLLGLEARDTIGRQ